MNQSLKFLNNMASPCRLCPNKCNAKRAKGETGLCGLKDSIMVSSVQLHFGEERELVGKGGSGTVFFTGCNMKCLYCQNYDISWEMNGRPLSVNELVQAILNLEFQGAENINLVTPSPQIHLIAQALVKAKERGCKLPIVYNCGGYESLEVLQQLDGLIDIYMPDFKYADSRWGSQLSGVTDYTETAQAALIEMHKQVGDLVTDSRGVATKGLLVRHLILPGDLSGYKKVIDFIYYNVSRNTYINIMSQYRPCYRAYEIRDLKSPSIRSEWEEAVNYARSLGMTRGLK